METTRVAGLGLILLLAAGGALLALGARRQELDVRAVLARFLYAEEKGGRALGPPEVSPTRQMLLVLGCLGAGLALGLVLWPLQPIAALLAGAGLPIAGTLWARALSGMREKKQAAEDVLPLVAHLRQTLGRGVTPQEALRAYSREIEPGRALAFRVSGCLAAADTGADLHAAFEAWVARDNRHLQALSDLLRELKRSRDPQVTLDRLSRKIIGDLRQEMRLRVKRQALASIAVTVMGLFPPLMLALLEPAAFRMMQSIIFSGAF